MNEGTQTQPVAPITPHQPLGGGGVYSNIQIKQAIATGHIVFHPYIEEHIAGSSVDVTLGHWFYRTERLGEGGFYNPFDEADVTRYFDGPYHAEVHELWAEKNGRKLFAGIPADHPIIVLKPGERILGHTHEFIGIKAPGTSTMQARSTWGRNGVSVCLDAGWGDPGYINRWTMEIYNNNQHESVVLPIGERIAQLVFYHTGPVDTEYSKLSGKYQTTTSDNLVDIINNWRPEQMLPRAYRDQRRKPRNI
jgi:dCTP deaminase